MRREEAERESLGRTVRLVRQRRGLSVRALARAIDVSPATMSAIERGHTRVTADRLHDLAVALDIRADDLRSGRVPPALPPAGAACAASTSPWRTFDPLPMDSALRGGVAAFVAYGYHGSSMRLVAEFAGISVPGLYHHYPSKHDLLVGALDLAMADLTWRIDAALDEGRDRGLAPPERLGLGVEALALFHASRRDLAVIGASEMRSLHPADRRRIARVRTDVQRRIDGAILTCIRQGHLPVQDEAAAGRAITSMCVSICQWFDPAGPLTEAEVGRQYAEFALHLVGAGRRPRTDVGTGAAAWVT